MPVSPEGCVTEMLLRAQRRFDAECEWVDAELLRGNREVRLSHGIDQRIVDRLMVAYRKVGWLVEPFYEVGIRSTILMFKEPSK